MSWKRDGEWFIFQDRYTIDKDVNDILPKDIKNVELYNGLSVRIEQVGDLKCIFQDTLTNNKFYATPKLTINYLPFEIDELYVQCKFLNCFNGQKHLWESFLKHQTVITEPLNIESYNGNMNNILLKLLPHYDGTVHIPEWKIDDIQKVQVGIYKNIQNIELDKNLKSKLALIFTKMKRNTCSKEDLLNCHKNFNFLFYEYIVDKFTQYISIYLPNYSFTSVEETYFNMRLIIAIEKTGLPMHFLPSIKKQISNWHSSCKIELDTFDIPFYDSIHMSGHIGIENIQISVAGLSNGNTEIFIEKKHKIEM
eukprot:NODE_735_length_4344_cov_1.300118.p2 type:complete len:309 gc:universal NODE_735_length_4344_cov_1.300118:2946-3872(+)